MTEANRESKGPARFAGPLICGVDEAGRGPLAGPVVAAAVILSDDLDPTGIADSKTLSRLRRQQQRERIEESSSRWAFGIVGPEVVDEINILQATFLAMRTAVSELETIPDIVLVDGQFTIPSIDLKQRAIIRGDARNLAIAAASILAKTERDSLMDRYENKYPGYGFSRHKGYPTKEHILMLRKLGPCPIHRMSFQPVRNLFGKRAQN